MLAIRRYSALGALDTGFWVYREHFSLLFTISLIVSVPTAVAGAALSAQARRELPNIGTMLSLMGLLLVLSLVGNAFATGASTRVASRVAMGKQPTLGQAIHETLRCFRTILLASALVGLGLSAVGMLGAAVVGVTWALLTSAGIAAQIVVTGVLGSLAVAVVLLVWLRWALVIPVASIEPVSAGEAISRSGELSRGRHGKIMAVTSLIAAAALLVQGAVALIQLLIPGEGFTSQLLEALIGGASQALISPVAYVAFALLYYDARVEHEAFDVEVLTGQSAGQDTGQSAAPSAP